LICQVISIVNFRDVLLDFRKNVRCHRNEAWLLDEPYSEEALAPFQATSIGRIYSRNV